MLNSWHRPVMVRVPMYHRLCWPELHATLVSLLLLSASTTTGAPNSECRQSVVVDRAVLISSYNSSDTCNYALHVPPGTLPDHVFHLSLLAFSLGQSAGDGHACEGAWAQLGGSLYCGTSPAGTFLLFPTSKHRATLEVEVNPGTSAHAEFQARVELLPRLTLQERHPEMILATPGQLVRFSTCDRVYTCLQYPGYCQLTAPQFPGAYLRPANCSYTLQSPEAGVIIGGRHELFDVGGGNKILQECGEEQDHVAVYDGGQLVARFCGKGKRFPRIVSKTPDIVIRFVAAEAGPPNKGFVLSIERSPPHLTNHAQCSQNIKVGSNIQQLKSPHHWLPPGSKCSYTLSTKLGRQIWLLMSTIKTRSNCSDDDDFVSIFDGDELLQKYCRQNQTIEPLVASSGEMRIVYTSPNGTLDATSKFHFVARFTSVSATESGEHVAGTWCDSEFPRAPSGPFSLLTPRDLLLLHGSSSLNRSQQVVCKYRFTAPESYTVRLQLDRASFEPLNRCNSIADFCFSGNYDKIVVTEKLEKQYLGCECGARKPAQIFHSKGSEMILSLNLNLNYDLLNSSLKYSPELYQFHGRFQFIPPDERYLHCGLYVIANETLYFPTQQHLSVHTPILCHWLLKNISLSSLTLHQLNLSNDCKQNYLVLQQNSREVRLCDQEGLDKWGLRSDSASDINVYLTANKGRPYFNLSWMVNSRHADHDHDEQQPACVYPTLSPVILMVAAALCSMTVMLVIALLAWRYRESLSFTFSSRGRRRYSSVKRHVAGAFW